jgi:hypothetical protein
VCAACTSYIRSFSSFIYRFLIICDNASSHDETSLQRECDGTKCCYLFLPPYSPQLNPAEGVFSIVKTNTRYQLDACIDRRFPYIFRSLLQDNNNRMREADRQPGKAEAKRVILLECIQQALQAVTKDKVFGLYSQTLAYHQQCVSLDDLVNK